MIHRNGKGRFEGLVTNYCVCTTTYNRSDMNEWTNQLLLMSGHLLGLHEVKTFKELGNVKKVDYGPMAYVGGGVGVFI